VCAAPVLCAVLKLANCRQMPECLRPKASKVDSSMIGKLNTLLTACLQSPSINGVPVGKVIPDWNNQHDW
jgi:hypothetical protein